MTQEVRGNMSHVDEGTLHAYLDGELIPVERTRLEAHIGECAQCRGRLEEERALIERASGLLGLAQPPERSVPPLHQLRRPRLAWRLRVPLAWAATVVLALGIGYYAGNERLARAPDVHGLVRDSPVANTVTADSGTTLATRENTADGLASAERDRVAARPQAQVATPAQKRAAPEPQLYIDGAPIQPVRENASVALRDSAATASGVIALQPRDVRPAPAPSPASTPAARPDALQLTLQAAVVERRSEAADRSRLVATQWPIIRRGPARSILGAEPLGVPGLAVRNIRRSPGGQVVLVEQAIDSATVIQLFQERAESDQLTPRSYYRSDSAQAQEEGARIQVRGKTAGTERLARFIGGVRVEIAGPLSADSLNRLLEQVRPIGP